MCLLRIRLLISVMGYFLLSVAYAAQCDLTPTTNKLMPITAKNYQIGGAFIEDFASHNDCTIQCQCVYDQAQSKWRVVTTTNKSCLYAAQCEACGKNDKTCEVRFPQYFSPNIYIATFSAIQTQPMKLQNCSQDQSGDKPMVCTSVNTLSDDSFFKAFRQKGN